MNSNLEIVDVDEERTIILPYSICEKMRIYPHDKLIIGVKDDTLIIVKQKSSVFDLQRKEVAAGTLKQALIFERTINQAGKKDMPV
jgi:bifunctional DNA-binding transcriptional regulator/antitoxin component of YhaV-PrlF toxin-antitoxin module